MDTESLQKAGISTKAILDFYRAFDDIGGENHALIITKDGKRVYEEYCSPYDQTSPHNMFSVTKCLVSIAVGFAIDEGLIALDDKILPYFADYPHKDSKRWDEVTVRSLLTMHSGKKFSFLQDMTADHTALFMRAGFRAKRGFLYSNNDSHVLSALVTKLTGQPLDEYLDSRLFAPLGIAKPFWEKNKLGVCVGGSGVFLTARELATIAECVAAGGRHGDRQVIPAAYLAEATKAQVKPSKTYHADGFGYYFWQDGDTYRMEGLFGQFAVIVPAQNAIVTLLSMHPSDNLIAKTVQDSLIAHLFEPSTEQDAAALAAYLNERARRIVPLATPRDSDREAALGGNAYRRKGIATDLCKAFTHFNNGLVPNAIHSSYPDRPHDSFDNIRLDFAKDELTVRWQEGDVPVCFKAGLAGQAIVSEVQMLQWRYQVWAYAYWDKGRLHVATRLINSIVSKEFIFEPTKGGLKLRTECKPDFAVFCGYNSVASGTFPSVPLLTPCLVGILKGALSITKLAVRFGKRR